MQGAGAYGQHSSGMQELADLPKPPDWEQIHINPNWLDPFWQWLEAQQKSIAFSSWLATWEIAAVSNDVSGFLDASEERFPDDNEWLFAWKEIVTEAVRDFPSLENTELEVLTHQELIEAIRNSHGQDPTDFSSFARIVAELAMGKVAGEIGSFHTYCQLMAPEESYAPQSISKPMGKTPWQTTTPEQKAEFRSLYADVNEGDVENFFNQGVTEWIQGAGQDWETYNAQAQTEAVSTYMPYAVTVITSTHGMSDATPYAVTEIPDSRTKQAKEDALGTLDEEESKGFNWGAKGQEERRRRRLKDEMRQNKERIQAEVDRRKPGADPQQRTVHKAQERGIKVHSTVKIIARVGDHILKELTAENTYGGLSNLPNTPLGEHGHQLSGMRFDFLTPEVVKSLEELFSNFSKNVTDCATTMAIEARNKQGKFDSYKLNSQETSTPVAGMTFTVESTASLVTAGQAMNTNFTVNISPAISITDHNKEVKKDKLDNGKGVKKCGFLCVKDKDFIWLQGKSGAVEDYVAQLCLAVDPSSNSQRSITRENQTFGRNLLRVSPPALVEKVKNGLTDVTDLKVVAAKK